MWRMSKPAMKADAGVTIDSPRKEGEDQTTLDNVDLGRAHEKVLAKKDPIETLQLERDGSDDWVETRAPPAVATNLERGTRLRRAWPIAAIALVGVVAAVAFATGDEPEVTTPRAERPTEHQAEPPTSATPDARFEYDPPATHPAPPPANEPGESSDTPPGESLAEPAPPAPRGAQPPISDPAQEPSPEPAPPPRRPRLPRPRKKTRIPAGI
jgi:hypothetical protein